MSCTRLRVEDTAPGAPPKRVELAHGCSGIRHAAHRKNGVLHNGRIPASTVHPSQCGIVEPVERPVVQIRIVTRLRRDGPVGQGR